MTGAKKVIKRNRKRAIFCSNENDKKGGRFEKDVRSLWNNENGPRPQKASMSRTAKKVGVKLIFSRDR